MKNLLQLSSDKLWDKIFDKYATGGGVYKLIAVRNKKRKPIPRLLGNDNEGILYIGKSTPLRRICNTFRICQCQ